MSIQFLRGTTSECDSYTGPVGSFTIDITLNNIRVHDGVTQGGHVIANLENLNGSVDAATLDGTQPYHYSQREDLPLTPLSASEAGYSGTSDISGYSHLRGGTIGLADGSTYQEAIKIADQNGVRLPTRQELEALLTKGTGGGNDTEYNWTCTPVPGKPGYYYAVKGNPEWAGGPIELNSDGTDTASVRVVASVDASGHWHDANVESRMLSKFGIEKTGTSEVTVHGTLVIADS